MERIRVTFVKEVCSEEWENCFPRFLSQRQHLFQFHCCELGPVSIPNQWSLARRVELCCWMLTWAFRALGEVGFPQIRVISKGWKPVSTAGWIYILFMVDLHVLAQCVVLWSIEVSMNIWLFFVVVIKQPFIYITGGGGRSWVGLKKTELNQSLSETSMYPCDRAVTCPTRGCCDSRKGWRLIRCCH